MDKIIFCVFFLGTHSALAAANNANSSVDFACREAIVQHAQKYYASQLPNTKVMGGYVITDNNGQLTIESAARSVSLSGTSMNLDCRTGRANPPMLNSALNSMLPTYQAKGWLTVAGRSKSLQSPTTQEEGTSWNLLMAQCQSSSDPSIRGLLQNYGVSLNPVPAGAGKAGTGAE